MKQVLTGTTNLLVGTRFSKAVGHSQRGRGSDRNDHSSAIISGHLLRRSVELTMVLSSVISLALGGPLPGQQPASRTAPRSAAAGGPRKYGRREGKLRVGDMAPTFDLKRLHSEDRVGLGDFRNKKPVALVFGSYT